LELFAPFLSVRLVLCFVLYRGDEREPRQQQRRFGGAGDRGRRLDDVAVDRFGEPADQIVDERAAAVDLVGDGQESLRLEFLRRGQEAIETREQRVQAAIER